MKVCRDVVLATLDKHISLLDSAVLNHLAVTNPMVFDVENLTKLNEIKKKAVELEIPCLLGVTEGNHKYGEVYVTSKTMLAVGPLPYSKSKDFLNKIARELELGSKKLRYDLVDLINYNEEEEMN